MKVILTFMLTKNKKAFLFFFILLLSCGGLGLYLVENNSQVVKIPIVYEDLDQSRASTELIASLNKTQSIQLIEASDLSLSIEESVKTNKATIGLIIPENFQKNLQQGKTRQTIILYRSSSMMADISIEVASEALYRQQIPYIVTKHLNGEKTFSQVVASYTKNMPTSKLEKEQLNKVENAKTPLAIALIVIILFASTSQLFLFRRLRQFLVLRRLSRFSAATTWLFISYVLFVTSILFIVSVLLSLLFNAAIDYGPTIQWLVVFELFVAGLFFKIKTKSHALFMTIIWTVMYSAFYLYVQLLGGFL